ncbi:MAG TPA: NADPH-dependent oxidoreductase [Kofleriaceae bacterium]|jgi:nitroreductase|nr:NADPH-dependent oxidoreductase [Kofleriaceae bacterium]
MTMHEPAAGGRAVSSETLRVLEDRASVREFTADFVEDELVMTILRAACRAPTSDNLQAYSFIVVRDPDRRAELARLAGNQRHIAEAPVFIAVCADLSRIARACEMHEASFAGASFEIGLVAAIDASLAGMSAALAAESLGLGCVMIGGVRNSPVEITHLLGLPPRVFVLFGMCLGWPRQRPPQKPRLPDGAVIFHERYDSTGMAQAIAAYDEDLAGHYRRVGKPTHDASWSRRIAENFSIARARRTDLRATLAKLGLDFL